MTDFTRAAEELTADLAAIDAGTYPAKVVLARYTGWEILGVTRLWGLQSDASRKLRELLREVGRAA